MKDTMPTGKKIEKQNEERAKIEEIDYEMLNSLQVITPEDLDNAYNQGFEDGANSVEALNEK